MVKVSSSLDKILEKVVSISKEDRELLVKACMNRYHEIKNEIRELENKKDLYESFVIGFPLGAFATGILVAGWGFFYYLKGNIQYMMHLSEAYVISALIFLPIPFIFYRLAKRVEEKIDKKESEALLYQLCYNLFKER